MTYSGGRLTPANSSDSPVEQALAYAAAGVPVFPVWGAVLAPDGTWSCQCGAPPSGSHNAAKHPATAHGHNDAVLVDRAAAEAWFSTGKNLAVPGGDGLVVVDVDPRHDGFTTLDDWESWTGGTELPATLECQTGSGGLHLYYHLPAGARVVSRNMVLPGIDIKSEGGYLVAPTARHVSGGLYRWVDPEVPVATVPGDLLTWLLTRRGGTSGAGGETPDGYDHAQGAVAGQRDAYFNDVAFRLRKTGVSRPRAETAMRDAWEAADQPEGDHYPWDTALAKLDRVWDTVEPDAPASVPAWPGVTSPALVSTRADQPGGPTVVSGSGETVPSAAGASPPVTVLHGTVVDEPRQPEHGTDMGNSARFARLMRDRVRYVPDEDRWYVWDGSTLAPDTMNEVTQLTKAVVADIRDQALAETDTAARDRWVQWAMTTESYAKRQVMLAGAQSESPLAVPVAALDADPMLLVVENGTLDLRTGVLRASRLGDLCTHRADVWHDPDATCPMWEAHLALVTDGDPHLTAYLQRACGYSLTGLVSEQKFWFLHGSGANGKNVFTETVLGLLGTYGKVAPMGLITNDGEHPTILAGLRGARMVMSDETGVGKRMNDARLKMLTGSAKVSARFMGKDFFEYDATMKLWILGNAKPVIRDTSEGMWRRMQLVPFEAQIPAARQVMQYEEVLRSERSGILNWCLAGLKSWQTLEGVGTPAVVREAVSKYRSEEDHLGQFLEQCTARDPQGEAFTTNGSLFMSYQLWCAMQGLRGDDVLNSITLSRELVSRRYTRDSQRVNGKMSRGFVGLKLAADGHEI